jgi:phosphoglycolate phosphatase
MNKYDLVIFDLDGVLFNSKENMKTSWNMVRKKFKIQKSFDEYFKFIGYPFFEILKKLSIKKNFSKIQTEYNKNSLKNLNKIKLYKDIKLVLKYLNKKKIKLAIVTSKNKNRTLKLVKKFKLPITNIVCPSKLTRGKPYPDQINIALKRANIKRRKTLYVGDMHVDYLLAKKSKINFVFAKYGYGKVDKYKYFNTINSFKDLKSFI